MTPRPITEGDRHSLLGGLSVGDDHPQYLSKHSFYNLTRGFVFAADQKYGISPDGSDVTDRILALLADATIPDGSTIVFTPGTYVLSAQILWNRPLGIYGLGAIFDWGTSWDASGTWSFPTLATPAAADAAFVYGYAPASGVTTFQGLQVFGLKIKRTVTGTDQASNYRGAGIRFYSLYSCQIDNVETEGFGVGQWFSGSVNTGYERGFAYNNISDPKMTRCATGMLLEPGDSAAGKSGWCNENTWLGGRIAFDVTTSQAEADKCVGQYLRFAVADAHESNNNRFFGMSIESNGTRYWGRKVYCEGRYNEWAFCRWEDIVVHGTTDIEFVNSGSGGGSNNVLFYGFDLYKQNVVGLGANLFNHRLDQIQMDMDQNHVIRGRSVEMGLLGSLYSQSQFRGNGATAPIRVFNTSSPSATANSIAVRNNGNTRDTGHIRESYDNSLFGACFVPCDSGGTERNAITMRLASPYDMATPKGFEVGERLCTPKVQAIADASTAVDATCAVVRMTSLTAARAPTLPAATGSGRRIMLKDASGSCSAVNTITWTRAAADTIDGATTLVFTVAYQSAELYDAAAGVWDVIG